MLKDLCIDEFMDRLSSKDAPVGGGSAAALSGLLAAGLVKMAVSHSLANPSLCGRQDFFGDILSRLGLLSDELTGLIDQDAAALAELIEAFTSFAADTVGEPAPTCQNEMAVYLETAAKVPLETAAACLQVLELASTIAPLVEDNLKSELMTAVISAHAGATGALMSTAVNLSHLKDESLIACLKKEMRAAAARADELKNKTENLIFQDYPFCVFRS